MSHDDSVVIVSATRTPIGAINGIFKELPAHTLGKTVIKDLLKRTGVQGEEISEIILGQIMQAHTGPNPARQAAMHAGIPKEIPSLVINQLCGSALRAICMGFQAIRNGDSTIVIAGGQECMSQSPHAYPMHSSTGGKFVNTMLYDALIDPFYNIHVVNTAENIARQFKVSREEQDEFAAFSQNKCEVARKLGKFNDEIVPVIIPSKDGDIILDKDETPRDGVTKDILAKLKPAFMRESSVTGGNASGISDGAAAVMLMTQKESERRGLQPLATIKSWGEAGVDPAIMGTAPVPASQKALAKARWSVSDLDLIEANEAFASQAIYVNRHMEWDLTRVNVNGGAIALGHPFGAAGARILTTLLYEMQRRDAKKALATLCIGGGLGIAICVERN